jgi:hypothetical protein
MVFTSSNAVMSLLSEVVNQPPYFGLAATVVVDIGASVRDEEVV